MPQRDYVAPLQPEALHAPEPEPPVAPIVPPPETLRFGDNVMPAPDFLSPEQVDQVNMAGAQPEAQISQYFRSVGIAPSRADRMASAALASAAQGAAIGCGLGAFTSAAFIFTLPLLPVACVGWGALGAVVGGVIGAENGTRQ
ncbi:hypothetical protein BJY24_003209 [Nocardia transvalensis]|uniref:Uncharacterized protein n=1 Tax=Nocardia transvalensis TaxID=37333 RepID=A0A7W9UIM3_9NOCA|nr:hypothetical protein [Nocardia transvalensis]MBB5914342.1 hypothetical protein [Nocardia transvalensis]